MCRCPKCGLGRYVVDPQDNSLRPAKVFFFFPVASYIRSLFARPDVVTHLYHDPDGRPESHTFRSRGFKKKIIDNPHMNTDHRNLGLVATTDGVPFFDDQRRGHSTHIQTCPFSVLNKLCVTCRCMALRAAMCQSSGHPLHAHVELPSTSAKCQRVLGEGCQCGGSSSTHSCTQEPQAPPHRDCR